jgi:rhodanese-related sulfurtransferase
MLSTKVALQLAERGFYVKEMNAGWSEWTREGLPVEPAAAQASKA